MINIKKIIYVILLVNTCFVLSMEKEQDKKEQVKEKYTVNTSKEDANKLWHGLNDSSGADFSSSASSTSSSSSQSSSALSVSSRSEEWNKEGYQNYLEEKEIKNILDQAIKTGKIGKINADQESKFRKLIVRVYGAELNQIVPRGIDSVNLGAQIKKYEYNEFFEGCSPDGKLVLMNSYEGSSLLNVEDLNKICTIWDKKAIGGKLCSNEDTHKLIRNGKLLFLNSEYKEKGRKNTLFDSQNLNTPLLELEFDAESNKKVSSDISPNGKLIIANILGKEKATFKIYKVYSLDEEDSNNILPRNVMQIISEYDGFRAKIFNEVIGQGVFRVDKFDFINDEKWCALAELGNYLMLFDNSNNVTKTINLKLDIKSEHPFYFRISPDSKNILIKTTYFDPYNSSDTRSYLVKLEDIYNNNSVNLNKLGEIEYGDSIFSGDSKYLLSSVKDTYNIKKIVDNGLELFCEFRLNDHISLFYLAPNCRFFIGGSPFGEFSIYDLANTCIWDDLSSEQLIYVIRLISGLEDGGDIDKIFANLGNKFIERLKEYFKFSFNKSLSALPSKVMKIINSYRF